MTAPRSLIQRLADALHDAAEDVESWGNYASSYFQEKHDLPGNVARIHTLANEARAYLAQPEPQGPTDEERFEHWWYHEGSAPPRSEDDLEEHTHRTSKIAWLNGAYCARYGNRTPAPNHKVQS